MTFSPTTPRMIEAERKRAILIREATVAFEVHGYEGVDLRTLAKSCGFSTGAIFGKFLSKQTLFVECFPQDHERRRVAEAICLAMGENWVTGPRDQWWISADVALAALPFPTFRGEAA